MPDGPSIRVMTLTALYPITSPEYAVHHQPPPPQQTTTANGSPPATPTSNLEYEPNLPDPLVNSNHSKQLLVNCLPAICLLSTAKPNHYIISAAAGIIFRRQGTQFWFVSSPRTFYPGSTTLPRFTRHPSYYCSASRSRSRSRQSHNHHRGSSLPNDLATVFLVPLPRLQTADRTSAAS